MHRFSMKSLAVAGLVVVFAVVPSDAASAQLGVGEAQAMLDLSTGDVILELGSNLQVLIFEGSLFDGSAIEAAIDENPSLGGGLFENFPEQLVLLSLTPIPPGSYNLDSVIIESNRTPEGVADFEFQFSQAGFPAITATVGNGVTVLNAVPEPGSLSLIGLIGLGAIAGRRR